MTLLVDNQLPMALARHLSALGCECIHVRDVGLDEATDHSIWEYAKERNLAIVTKDEDFQATQRFSDVLLWGNRILRRRRQGSRAVFA